MKKNKIIILKKAHYWNGMLKMYNKKFKNLIKKVKNQKVKL